MGKFTLWHCYAIFLVLFGSVCQIQGCPEGQFACEDGKKCILAKYKCDGYEDCRDGSDETTEECGATCENVKGGGFACDSVKCIKAEYKCDGFNSCDDGSDETTELCGANCEKVEGRFACTDGQCIHDLFKCDGLGYPFGCHDGSDEDPSLCGRSVIRPLLDQSLRFQYS